MYEFLATMQRTVEDLSLYTHSYLRQYVSHGHHHEYAPCSRFPLVQKSSEYVPCASLSQAENYQATVVFTDFNTCFGQKVIGNVMCTLVTEFRDKYSVEIFKLFKGYNILSINIF